MSSIKRLARATTTWLTRADNDLTTLSDRDLHEVGLVRQQRQKLQVICVNLSARLFTAPLVWEDRAMRGFYFAAYMCVSSDTESTLSG